MTLMEEISLAANNWEKTKDSKYKDEWYGLVHKYSRIYAYPRHTYPKRENRGIGFKGEKSNNILS